MHAHRHAHSSPCHACEGQRATCAPGIDLSQAWWQATYPATSHLCPLKKMPFGMYTNYYMYLFSLCAYIRECTCAMISWWRSWDSTWRSVPFFYPVTPGNQLRLGNKGRYPLNDRTSPKDILVHVNTFPASFLCLAPGDALISSACTSNAPTQVSLRPSLVSLTFYSSIHYISIGHRSVHWTNMDLKTNKQKKSG